MKKARFIYILLALSLITFPGFTQGLYNTGSTRGAGLLSGQLPENARFNLELGTGFTSFSSGAGMLGSYISPRLEYDLSPSFTITTGGSFGFNRYSNLPLSLVVNSNAGPVQQGGLTDYSLYMSGRYKINDNLFMTGSVYREQGQLPPLMMNRGAMDYSSQGMSMGLEYRISDNLHFGAEVGVRRSDNPYHFYSPFSDPFNSRHSRSRHRLGPW